MNEAGEEPSKELNAGDLEEVNEDPSEVKENCGDAKEDLGGVTETGQIEDNRKESNLLDVLADMAGNEKDINNNKPVFKNKDRARENCNKNVSKNNQGSTDNLIEEDLPKREVPNFICNLE